MNRRDFFSTLAFGFLSFFVTRKTQAKVAIKHSEGRTIPRGLYISQVVGRGRPIRPQEPIPILHLKSVVEPVELGLRGPIGPTFPFPSKALNSDPRCAQPLEPKS